MARRIIFERENDAFSICNIGRRRRVPDVYRTHIDVYINSRRFFPHACSETKEAGRRKTFSRKGKKTSNTERSTQQYVTSRNNFDSLPDEIILNIFKRLPENQLGNVASVCRRFKHIVDDTSLWEMIDASYRVISPDALKGIMERPVKILRLVESRVCKIPEPYPCRLWRLIHLDLTGADTSEYTLTAILNKCNNLKRLSLARVSVTDNVIVALCPNQDLEVLKLEWTRGITMEIMEMILANCGKLKELNLANTELSVHCVHYICRNIPSGLEKFNISGCRNLRNEHVEQIVKRCPHIRELDVSFCDSLTLNVVPILQTLNELRILDITGCRIPQAPLSTLRTLKNGVYLNVHDGRRELLPDMRRRVIRSFL